LPSRFAPAGLGQATADVELACMRFTKKKEKERALLSSSHGSIKLIAD
jgi:hypothetical protein